VSNAVAEELPKLEAQIRALAEQHPGEALFAIMEALIDVACGENPALRDFKRMWFYRGVLSKLAKKGIR